jgi:endogenous inhibitor of DNA gyrase (YacG/DUF329 family)
MAIADEAYIKHCHFCGKKVKRPILYKGYVFCSEKCKESFISSGEKIQQ